MICPNCGATIRERLRFCPFCGIRLAQHGDSVTPDSRGATGSLSCGLGQKLGRFWGSRKIWCLLTLGIVLVVVLAATLGTVLLRGDSSKVVGHAGVDAPRNCVIGEGNQYVSTKEWQAYGPGAEVSRLEVEANGVMLTLIITFASDLPELPLPTLSQYSPYGTLNISLSLSLWNKDDQDSAQALGVDAMQGYDNWVVSRVGSEAEDYAMQTLPVKPRVRENVMRVDLPLEYLGNLQAPFELQMASLWTVFPPIDTADSPNTILFSQFLPGGGVGWGEETLRFPGSEKAARKADSKSTGTTGPTTVAAGSLDTVSSTIPRDSTSTTIVEPTDAYLQVSRNLAALLQSDDQRIPQLATQINSTAPDVPQAVYDELQNMSSTVGSALQTLKDVTPPSAFTQANSYLEQAAIAMVTRIDETAAGIQAMWSSGTVTVGTPHFDAGRTARDNYRAAFQKYQAVLPVGQ